MAIWQFAVDFIPRRNLIKRFGEIPKAIDGEISLKEELEAGVILPPDFERWLNCIGEKEILNWGSNNLNWGDYDNGTHLTINDQYKDKVTVFSRFHVGDYNEIFVKAVLEFAKICDCVLLTKNGTIIEPEIDLFIGEVKKSNSYRFCKDPIGYLQSNEVKEFNWDSKKKLADNEFNFNS
jgi:hypothetical protein